jgi:hypothetical protein
MSKGIALVLAVACTGSASAIERDELCAKIDAFDRDVSQSNGAKPQWIEVYWDFDPESIWSIACKRLDLPGPREFCAWVPDNVSMEFSARLPERIWDCHRTGNNPFRERKFKKRDIVFRTKSGGSLLMQTRGVPAPWLRLAVFPKGMKVSAEALAPPGPYKE